MTSYAHIEHLLTDTLSLRRRPVAIAFRDTAPAGVAAFVGSLPSGCSFWKLAAEGRTFYTVPGDHYNCPIGSYTHNIALPPGRRRNCCRRCPRWPRSATSAWRKCPPFPGSPRLPQSSSTRRSARRRWTRTWSSSPASRTAHAAARGRDAQRHRRAAALRPADLHDGPASATQSVVSSMGCIGNRTTPDSPTASCTPACQGNSSTRLPSTGDDRDGKRDARAVLRGEAGRAHDVSGRSGKVEKWKSK